MNKKLIVITIDADYPREDIYDILYQVSIIVRAGIDATDNEDNFSRSAFQVNKYLINVEVAKNK